ncbi:hypothetical protein DTL42_19660 [Bremerella cremea]|uniref:Uncharacterized protein n=1 Tax=Bremerella cremea TaxID=1031537 RepID=A0A368KLJ6_9BACT|nr:hypothetical protein DTL42_19660 [Bremerella cremea]
MPLRPPVITINGKTSRVLVEDYADSGEAVVGAANDFATLSPCSSGQKALPFQQPIARIVEMTRPSNHAVLAIIATVKVVDPK